MSDKVLHMKPAAAPTVGSLRRMLDALREWNTRRLAKAELQALPNHLLNDIGVSRELIDQYVDGTIVKRSASVANVVELDRSDAGRPADRAKAA